MKKKDKLNLIRYAVNDYNKKFNLDLKPIYISKYGIRSLLKEYPHSEMCIWSYCCYGLYENCWQDPIGEGIWDMTQEMVNKSILSVFTPKLLRQCRRENRIFWCEKDGNVEIFVIVRDLWREDYLITLSKKEL